MTKKASLFHFTFTFISLSLHFTSQLTLKSRTLRSPPLSTINFCRVDPYGYRVDDQKVRGRHDGKAGSTEGLDVHSRAAGVYIFGEIVFNFLKETKV